LDAGVGALPQRRRAQRPRRRGAARTAPPRPRALHAVRGAATHTGLRTTPLAIWHLRRGGDAARAAPWTLTQRAST
jgi:hypothetical protein